MSATTITDHALQRCFDALVKAAVAGERCPLNGHNGVDSIYTSGLAARGDVKVEISGHNYRTVTILTGPHAGARTAPDPSGMFVWRIIDQRGAYRVRRDGTPFLPPRQPTQHSTVLAAG